MGALAKSGMENVLNEVITSEMQEIKSLIARAFAKRDSLKKEMQQWYETHTGECFDKNVELMLVDSMLSELDMRYKTLWDYHNKK